MHAGIGAVAAVALCAVDGGEQESVGYRLEPAQIGWGMRRHRPINSNSSRRRAHGDARMTSALGKRNAVLLQAFERLR